MRMSAAAKAGAALTALACGFVGLATASAGTAGAASGSAAARWPARLVLREPLRLAVTNQVIDPRTRVAFELSAIDHGSAFRLRKLPLNGGPASSGPRFLVNGIGIGAGSVWVFGGRPAAHSALRMVLYQVNPATLAITRTWSLSPAERESGLIGFSAGAGGTVWVGFLRTVLRINATNGVIVRTIRVASGLTVSDVAVDPAGRHLYVLANTTLGSTTAIEYNAATGRKLASNAGGDLRFSAGGARATAVPGAVWVSFRTGSLGETVLLAQQGLRMVKLPGSGSPGSLFHWVMFASTEYAGGSLLLARQDGIIACLAPRTGHVRARGTVSKLIGSGQLLGANHGGRLLYGLAPAGVIAISPPAACRS